MSDSDSISASTAPPAQTAPAAMLVSALSPAELHSEWALAGDDAQTMPGSIDAISAVPLTADPDLAAAAESDGDPLIGVPATEIASLEAMQHDAAEWLPDHSAVANAYGAPLDHVDWQFVGLQ